jgi:hypothetical protein
MLGQIVRAQFDMGHAIDEVIRHGGNAAPARDQLKALGVLQHRIGKADSAALATMSSMIASAVAETRAMIQQASSAASVQITAELQELKEASSAGRESVNRFVHDFYDEKKFDPYLRFSSQQDEEDYRRRQAENKRAIELALAKHTPEGNLEAVALAKRQVEDAGAHGADQSPDYATQMKSLNEAQERLSTAIKTNGGNTDRADAILATKLDERLDGKQSPAQQEKHDAELSDVFAALKSAGVTTRVADAEKSGHGLSVAKPASAIALT